MEPKRSGAARRWLMGITAPHPSIVAPADRRRARLAAALFLALVGVGAVLLVPMPGTDADDALRSFGWLSATILLLLAAHGLVRRGRVDLGIGLGVGTALLAVWTYYVFEPRDHASVQTLYFSAVPILLSTLLLRGRYALAMAIANLASVGAVAVATEAGITVFAADDVRNVFWVLLVISALALVGAGLLQRSARDTEEANRRLQEADAYRLRLLQTVMHDLNSPLTPIVLQMHMLAREAPPGSEKAIAVIGRNVELLKRLVADVRDLASLESGRLGLLPRAVDLGLLVQQAAGTFAADASARGRELRVEAEEGLTVDADPDRVQQVVHNLVSNALKFTKADVRVRARKAGRQAEVRVEDDGRGLTGEEIARLFKPFSQVHDRGEVQEKGTGLGLYISKGIVEGHGGRLWVESAGHGKGSEFQFTLPLRGP